mgnify:CR=1 FL=1
MSRQLTDDWLKAEGWWLMALVGVVSESVEAYPTEWWRKLTGPPGPLVSHGHGVEPGDSTDRPADMV